MRKILVLGGTKYFGQKLVQRLLENADQVTVATRGSHDDEFGKQVERLKIDREDKSSMMTAFEGKSWDLVYDQSCLASQEAWDAAEALKGKCSRYIFTSTQAVYEFGTNHKEESFDPMSFPFQLKKRADYQGYAGYQEAKRAAEAVLFQQGYFKIAAVRMPIVVSEDDYTERLKFYVDAIKQSSPIVIKDPDFRYSFIHAEEAAEFLFQLGNSDFTGSINPGCREDISLDELVRKIGRIVERKPLIEYNQTGEKGSPYALPGSWSIHTGKAQSLGFSFSKLDEVLDPLIRSFQE